MKAYTKMIVRKVSALRKAGNSMEAIASKAGVSRVYLYQLTNGLAKNLTLAKAFDIAKNLGFKLIVKK